MDAYSMMVIIFVIIATVCIFGCAISTMLVYIDYNKMKKEYEKEIEHLKEERNICRLMLQKRNIQDGS